MAEQNVRATSNCNCGGLGCCCAGLLLGYLIWGGGDSPKERSRTGSGLEEVVAEERGVDGYLLRRIAEYKATVSPRLKEELGVERLCRYTPSCSTYAQDAIQAHGAVKGTALALARLARCHPLSEGGYDPVKFPEG
jgi:uncharacterized protein